MKHQRPQIDIGSSRQKLTWIRITIMNYIVYPWTSIAITLGASSPISEPFPSIARPITYNTSFSCSLYHPYLHDFFRRRASPVAHFVCQSKNTLITSWLASPVYLCHYFWPQSSYSWVSSQTYINVSPGWILKPIYHGVTTVSFPVYGDQDTNALHARVGRVWSRGRNCRCNGRNYTERYHRGSGQQ